MSETLGNRAVKAIAATFGWLTPNPDSQMAKIIDDLDSQRSGADIQRKITVLDACAQIFGGLRAVIGVLEKQEAAKANVGGDWNDGYAAAMSDSIKSITSFIEEQDGRQIAPLTACCCEKLREALIGEVGREHCHDTDCRMFDRDGSVGSGQCSCGLDEVIIASAAALAQSCTYQEGSGSEEEWKQVAKEMAARDQLWTTQEDVELNLLIFAARISPPASVEAWEDLGPDEHLEAGDTLIFTGKGDSVWQRRVSAKEETK